MRSLLRAEGARLRKYWLFWVCAAGVLAYSLLMSYDAASSEMKWAGMGYEYNGASAYDMIFGMVPVLGLLPAIFCGLFLSSEYSDGTLRNKLIVGHTRTQVYLSALAVNLAAIGVFLLAWMLGSLTVFFYPVSFLPYEVSKLAAYYLVAFVSTMAFTALLLVPCMLSTNRAATAVITILMWLGMLLGGSIVYNALSEPETICDMWMTVGETIEYGEPYANPNYVTEPLRRVFQWLHNLLPAGQWIQVANDEMTQYAVPLLGSLGLGVLSTTVGLLFFRRKNLK